MVDYIKVPEDIERRSFKIIEEEMGESVKKFSDEELPIVKRVIHTTADFEYSSLIEFHNSAIAKGMEALKKGFNIYCDTNMIVNGLNSKALKHFKIEAYTLVNNVEVAEIAKSRGITRSIAGVEKASEDKKTKIFIIGNAPTALFRLKELIEKKEIDPPELIIGVPVGFVGAEESKRIFIDSNIPYITVKGRKGGSTVAVSILHGILYQIYQR